MLILLTAAELQTHYAGVGVGIAAIGALLVFLGRFVMSLFRKEGDAGDESDDGEDSV